MNYTKLGNKKLIVIGIESTCDETGISLISMDDNGNHEILSNVLKTQFLKHKKYGGVVPEIAARSHLSIIDDLVKKALNEAKIKLKDIDAIATSCGPGLIGGLIVGSSFGKGLSLALDIPFIPVNHLEAHVLFPRMINKIDFPYLVLLISGGHTQILKIEGVSEAKRLSSTIDDSVGESFDKASIMLNLGWPGGVAIEKAALKGNHKSINLPRPILGKKNTNFSFSGLKTAFYRKSIAENLTPQRVNDLAASFQFAVTDILEDKSCNIIDLVLKEDKNIKSFVVSGGVAANKTIRKRLSNLSKQKKLDIFFPPIEFCTDNGAMIAWAGIEKIKRYGLIKVNDFSFEPRPRWPLDSEAEAIGLSKFPK